MLSRDLLESENHIFSYIVRLASSPLYNPSNFLVRTKHVLFKGLDEGSCSLDYLVTSVHLRGSPENVLFPESISDDKSRKRDARRMENLTKSCPNGLAQLCGLAQFCGLSKRSQPFFFKKKLKKHINP